MATITFKATPTTKKGDVVRYCGKAAKFWKVVEIESGIAKAVPDGFGPKDACC